MLMGTPASIAACERLGGVVSSFPRLLSALVLACLAVLGFGLLLAGGIPVPSARTPQLGFPGPRGVGKRSSIHYSSVRSPSPETDMKRSNSQGLSLLQVFGFRDP